MEFGLKEVDLECIIKSIEKIPAIYKAVIFGSRAKGNYKPGSDIDIAIYGEKIDFDTIANLHSVLDGENSMPYFFDVVDYTHCKHKEIKEHIDRVGKEIFHK